MLPADQAAALDRITADSLKGHLSFLASDLLEGRDTPSRGLDLAAEYIAAQFRRAGLEAIGDDGYFQTANWELAETAPGGFAFELKNGESPSFQRREGAGELAAPARVQRTVGPGLQDRRWRREGARVIDIPDRWKARPCWPRSPASAPETGPPPGR